MAAKVSAAPAATGAPAHRGDSEDTVELKEMVASQPAIPLEEDIMQLSRLGELVAIQKLFDSKKFDATYADEQGITPLHWAAINNHYALCQFLIKSGANINAKGGDAVATPVLWAAKRCNYYVVNLLLQHGADPLLTDDQGFNLLHSATLDGNILQLVLLIHQDIPVDIPDAQGHTSLMWAAYKGHPGCVDVLLRWGANVNATDDQGFTALHWALVKGTQASVQKLVEYGSDRFAANNQGKTPSVTAQEMNTVHQWHHALSECGYNSDGSPRYFPLSTLVSDRRLFLRRLLLLWPFFILYFVFSILSRTIIYIGVPVALATTWILHWMAQSSLRWAPPNMKHLHKTPYLAGVFTGTIAWIIIRWLFKILPSTYSSYIFLNLAFGVCCGLCAYCFFYSMLEDPGYVPKPGSRSQQKAIIEELLSSWKYDEQNFCVQCMIRRPVRSKHCKRCGRCVAKHDHHCPWLDNCVANNNHRHFLLYVITLEVGVLLLVRLTLAYLDALPNPTNPLSCTILSDDLCKTLNKDPFTILTVAWSSINLIWITMLLIVQLVQIARAQTTYESMHPSFRSSGHPHHPDAFTSFVTTGATSAAAAELTDSNRGPDPVVTAPGAGPAGAGHGSGAGADAESSRRPDGFFAQWKRLLGLDTAIATAMHGSNAADVRARDRANPFTRGVVRNCLDFWGDPAPLFGRRENGTARLGGETVNYARMYEPPLRLRTHGGGRAAEGGRYVAVGTDDEV